MRKINSTVKHDPENGTYGDCHRVCFAMVLGLEPEHVPHFYRDGDKGDRQEQENSIHAFLDGLGLVLVNVAYPVEDYDLILSTFASMAPNLAYILSGVSRSGCGHSVVCFGGEIFHDPTGNGIVGPMEDGYYWVTMFCPKPDGFRNLNEALQSIKESLRGFNE